MARSIALLGAGAFEWSPQAVVAITMVTPQAPLHFALFDPDDERLDLLDRFARHAAKALESDRRISATASPAEAARDADIVLWTVDLRCLSTHFGTGFADAHKQPAEDPRSIAELGLGDLNKPTPADQLSPMHIGRFERASRRIADEERDEALNSLSNEIPKGATVLMPQGLDLPPSVEHRAVGWPASTMGSDSSGQALQLLRWSKHEEHFAEMMESARQSELYASLS